MNQPDHDSPETIIEAVRDWQELIKAHSDAMLAARFDEAFLIKLDHEAAALRLRALRLPPEEEAKGIEYSGVCHCGEEMEGHSRGNHSPVEMTREGRRD